MIRRRKHKLDDSFDLFLDTITNTFGGVLLIALLIVLLIREPQDSHGQKQSTRTIEDSSVIESQIEALEAEKALLVNSASVRKDFVQQFQSPEAREQVTELAHKSNNKIAVTQRTHELTRQAKQLDSKIRNTENQRKELRQNLSDTENKILNLRKSLEHEKAERTRSIPLPKERESLKSEIPFVLKGDELFVVETIGDHAWNRSVNQSHFQSCSRAEADLELDSKYWKVRLGSGADIVAEPQSLKSIFKVYSSAKHHFTFVVRSDSFQKFSKLREQCVESGFEYRIIATDDLVSRSSGTSVKTQ